MYVIQANSIKGEEITMVGSPFIASNMITAIGIKDAIRDSIMRTAHLADSDLQIERDNHEECFIYDDNKQFGYIIKMTQTDVYNTTARFKEFLNLK